MRKDEFLRLMAKISDGTASDEEIRLYNAYFHSFQETPRASDEDLFDHQQEIGEELYDRISAERRRIENVTGISWRRVAAAASIFLCLAVGGYFMLHQQPAPRPASQNIKQNITPGSNKAILTLASGEEIVLTDSPNGVLSTQGNIRIVKKADGQVVYAPSTAAYTPDQSEKPVTYNTMTTPRGGQYHLVLSDGTQVWLNAASSIRYPTAFNGSEREVEITGEAYFEVATNVIKPFRVVSTGQIVEVLGTHFNISAYADDPIMKTTLITGSIRLGVAKQTAVLKPGQQGFFSRATKGQLKVKTADLDEVMAWKNGYFIFNNENIESIMQKISRWYDVDVSYQGNMKGKEFVGAVSRFKDVSEVLRKLEATGIIHFKVEGRKIIVMP